MKKWLRGIKSKVDSAADAWLHGEDRREEEARMAQAAEELEEVLRPVKEFIDATLNENLDANPAGVDIDRYYDIYVAAKEGKKKMLETMGVWSQDSEEPLLTQEEYEEKAKEGGWKFLRGSVGLPLCDLNKPRPDAWRTPPPKPHSVPETEAWDSEQKNS